MTPGPRVPFFRRERSRAVAFVAAWLGALSFVWIAVFAVVPRIPAPAEGVHANLSIVGEGWTTAYSGTGANNTVFRLLHEANATLGFELSWVAYSWPYDDVFVTSINGTKNDGSRNLWWQYCVNAVYATVGAATQSLHDGDIVTWVYARPGGDDLCR